MADLDSALPIKRIGTTAILIEDATAGTTLKASGVFEGSYSWTITGRTVVEATSQGRHKSVPALVETTDSTVSLEIEGKITSFKGNSNIHIYELLTQSGTAAAVVTTADGDAQAFKITITVIQAKQASPVTQTIVFAYCIVDSLSIEAGADDSISFKASFTDYENYPTPA
jgi:hypothetical protein